MFEPSVLIVRRKGGKFSIAPLTRPSQLRTNRCNCCCRMDAVMVQKLQNQRTVGRTIRLRVVMKSACNGKGCGTENFMRPCCTKGEKNESQYKSKCSAHPSETLPGVSLA